MEGPPQSVVCGSRLHNLYSYVDKEMDEAGVEEDRREEPPEVACQERNHHHGTKKKAARKVERSFKNFARVFGPEVNQGRSRRP